LLVKSTSPRVGLEAVPLLGPHAQQLRRLRCCGTAPRRRLHRRLRLLLNRRGTRRTPRGRRGGGAIGRGQRCRQKRGQSAAAAEPGRRPQLGGWAFVRNRHAPAAPASAGADGGGQVAAGPA
jgi:hypothetical protein